MKRIAIYHLETLLWIARLGTFRAAAERLNTTQPAISARVRELEDQLGIAIFQREGRRMVLTARGRELVRDCEPLWAGFERALLKASDFAGASGVVRIGAGRSRRPAVCPASSSRSSATCPA
jgi:DNA-binding transcriptional LysR family regulator